MKYQELLDDLMAIKIDPSIAAEAIRALAAENAKLRAALTDALYEYDISATQHGYVLDSDEILAARALLDNKEQGDEK
jgi:hypothetical protein